MTHVGDLRFGKKWGGLLCCLLFPFGSADQITLHGWVSFDSGLSGGVYLDGRAGLKHWAGTVMDLKGLWSAMIPIEGMDHPATDSNL